MTYNHAAFQRRIEARAERRIDIVGAMLALLRGHEPTGGAAVYAGCGLCDLETLAHVALPYGVRLGGTSTSEWANILQDVFTKRLLDFYYDRDPSYRRLTRRVPLSDYRRSALLSIGDYPQLEQVKEGAAVETGTITDAAESTMLLRLSRIFRATAELFANDDVGALNGIAELAADAAVFAENALFFAGLLSNSGNGPATADGVAFFNAAHGNVAAGAALDATSLGAALSLLRKQTSPSGSKLNLAGRLLVCGPDNEVRAHQAVAAITSGTTPLLDVVVDAHLAVTQGWYVFADPRVRPAFVHGFLRDRPDPDVTTRIGWVHDGPEWRVGVSVAMAVYDWRAAVRNPGA